MKKLIVYSLAVLIPLGLSAQTKNPGKGKQKGKGGSSMSNIQSAGNGGKTNMETGKGNGTTQTSQSGKGNGTVQNTQSGTGNSVNLNTNNSTGKNPSGTTYTPPQNVNWKDVSQNTQPFVQEKPNGSVNWTEQYIEAKGESAIDNQRFTNPAQAKLMAKRGAVVVAQRNLLEIIKGVNVTGETTVEDMITTKDYIYTRVDGVVKGAVQVGEPIEKDGIYTIRMRVPLYDRNGLAPALYNDLSSFRKDGGINVNGNGSADNGGRNNQNTNQNTTQGGNGTISTNPNDFNPFVFNLQGQKYDPSMFPVVTDEQGNILVDMSKVYDPNKGNFPAILNLGKEVTDAFGWEQGSQVINAISQPGKIVIPTKEKSKVDWAKVTNTIADIGRFVIRLF